MNPKGYCITQIVEAAIQCLRIRDQYIDIATGKVLGYTDNAVVSASGAIDLTAVDRKMQARSTESLDRRHTWALVCYGSSIQLGSISTKQIDTTEGRACLSEGVTCDRHGDMINPKTGV